MSELILRPANIEDAHFLLDLRNDPSTRANSRNTSEVSIASHLLWLQSQLQKPSTRLYIACVDGHSVGQVRIDEDQEISVSLHPSVRGRGLACPCLLRAIQLYVSEFPDTKVVKARIKEKNVASHKVFLRAGFFEVGRSKDHNVLYVFYEFRASSKPKHPM